MRRYLLFFAACLLLAHLFWVPVANLANRRHQGEAFWDSVRIVNRTDRALRVTPIAAPHFERDRKPFDYCVGPGLGFLTGQRGGFLLPAGREIEIRYYLNNMWMTEIVVETPEGDLLQLGGSPDDREWVIEDLGGLSQMSPAVEAAYYAAGTPLRQGWVSRLYIRFLVLTASLSALATLIVAAIRSSRRKGTPSDSPEAA